MTITTTYGGHSNVLLISGTGDMKIVSMGAVYTRILVQNYSAFPGHKHIQHIV